MAVFSIKEILTPISEEPMIPGSWKVESTKRCEPKQSQEQTEKWLLADTTGTSRGTMNTAMAR